jgi:hypothetical protein
MRITNYKPQPLAVTFTGKIITEQVDIIGNVIVLINRCKFTEGLRVTSNVSGGVDYWPQLIEIRDSDFPTDKPVYPIKISATKTPSRLIPSVVLDRGTASGNGKAYGQGGTPDNVAIHHCDSMELRDWISFDGGENGFSVNASKTIVMSGCEAHDNDGQGLHVGRFDTLLVEYAGIRGFRSTGNMKNQLGTAGRSVGVLLHNTLDTDISGLLSVGNEFAVSDQLREGNGRLFVSGQVYGTVKPHVLATANVVVESDLLVAM